MDQKTVASDTKIESEGVRHLFEMPFNLPTLTFKQNNIARWLIIEAPTHLYILHYNSSFNVDSML